MATLRLDGVLGALTHLASALIEESARTPGGQALDAVTFDATGCTVTGRVRVDGHLERFVVRLDVQPPSGARQALRLHVEEWPAHLPPLASLFRPLLERSSLLVDFDFSA
jgi:hypothetical protein